MKHIHVYEKDTAKSMEFKQSFENLNHCSLFLKIIDIFTLSGDHVKVNFWVGGHWPDTMLSLNYDYLMEKENFNLLKCIQ